MSPVSATETRTDALDVMTREIEASKTSQRATSRHRLAEMIAKETGISFRDALAEVEAYCETKEPAIPEYLATEFGIFWLKVIAVVWAGVGVFLFYNGAGLWRNGREAWPWWALGTVFCGIGAFFWVRSIEAESDRKEEKKDVRQQDDPFRVKY